MWMQETGCMSRSTRVDGVEYGSSGQIQARHAMQGPRTADMTGREHSDDWQRYIAAVDLGSNSFHMVIARENEQGGIQIVDKVREMVRLGAGLQIDGNLSQASRSRAVSCLERFRQRLQSIPRHRIRAVGTNTFRAAKNSQHFQVQAEQALGHPISVISGHEEARLIYLGAAFDLFVTKRKRLVIDIGGGSTELIVGSGFTPLAMDSLYIGCVSLTRRFFENGKITTDRIARAKRMVQRELETIVRKYRKEGWDEVVGTSGTIKATDRISRQLGIKEDWISASGVDAIEEWILECGHSAGLSWVSEQRREVFVGGFMILATIFREFGCDRIEVSEGALREGVAYDLIDRLHDEDSRFNGVRNLASLFGPDERQAQRVQSLAVSFLEQVEDGWGLKRPIYRKLLIWGAQLHEIGIGISYSHHHLHGAYMIENSDMNGFSRQVQRILALLVKNSRQKLHLSEEEWMTPEWAMAAKKLTVLLRLAITMYRGRSDMDLDGINILIRENGLVLTINPDWKMAHPLTMFDLETERAYLKSVGLNMQISPDSP